MQAISSRKRLRRLIQVKILTPFAVTPKPRLRHFARHPVVRIAVATGLLVASYAMYAPVLAVLLQQHGHGTAAIGAFAMIGFACIALLIPFMPKILARFGEVRACQAGTLMQFVATLAYASSDHIVVWCVFAAVGGAGAAAVWNGTEALIARHSPAHLRGRLAGLYQSLLGASMAAGPFAPGLFQLSAAQTLVSASIVQALGLLLVLGVARKLPSPHETATTKADSGAAIRPLALTTWGALRRVPALVCLALAGGVFEGGLASVTAAFGAASGLGLAAAASIVGALGAGSFLFQYPAGLIADRALPQRVFGAAGALLLASAILVAFAGQSIWLLWICAFVWGGVGGALYTLTMIRVAHLFHGQDTAAGSAAVITGYTLGGALGPPVSGAALQALGAPGLCVWLAALALGVMACARRVHR